MHTNNLRCVCDYKWLVKDKVVAFSDYEGSQLIKNGYVTVQIMFLIIIIKQRINVAKQFITFEKRVCMETNETP